MEHNLIIGQRTKCTSLINNKHITPTLECFEIGVYNTFIYSRDPSAAVPVCTVVIHESRYRRWLGHKIVSTFDC
jgi:hypothetical protein